MEKYTVEIDFNKTIKWYIFNTKMLHRLDGPAVEYANGTKYWLQNGRFHREDGPAVEYSDGTKEWFQNGQRHRLDGPACEYTNGNKYWYIEGVEYTKEEFIKKTTKQVSCDGKVFTDENGVKYKLVLV